MVACMLAILIFTLIPNKDPGFAFTFWGETIALFAFGISWMTKGNTLYPDKG
jgi:hypothetical protein